MVIYNKIFPFGNYVAINLFGIIFSKSKPLTDRTINHENIHTRQIIEMLFIFFYIWYGIEWLIRLIQYKNGHTAYRNISFEREAYYNELDYEYLNNRNKYRFLKYLSRHEQ